MIIMIIISKFLYKILLYVYMNNGYYNHKIIKNKENKRISWKKLRKLQEYSKKRVKILSEEEKKKTKMYGQTRYLNLSKQ